MAYSGQGGGGEFRKFWQGRARLDKFHICFGNNQENKGWGERQN